MGRAYYNENDKHAAAWLRELIKRNLIAPGDVDERSIADVQPSDLDGYIQCHFFAGIGGWSYALRLAAWHDERPVWTGSCPCQPFSSAGRLRGTRDERHLWPEFIRLIRGGRPAVVFGEQVANVEWMDVALGGLEDAGYAAWAEIRRASGVGAFHGRPRFYWWATPDTLSVGQPQPGERGENTSHYAADEFGEADRLVDAFRRGTLPFLCRGHDGVSARVGAIALRGIGNAIVPKVAAEFITAFCALSPSAKESPDV